MLLAGLAPSVRHGAEEFRLDRTSVNCRKKQGMSVETNNSSSSSYQTELFLQLSNFILESLYVSVQIFIINSTWMLQNLLDVRKSFLLSNSQLVTMSGRRQNHGTHAVRHSNVGTIIVEGDTVGTSTPGRHFRPVT